MPKSLPTLAPVPAPTLPSPWGSGRAARQARNSHGPIRPHPAVAQGEIVDHRSGHNGHPSDGHIEAPAPLLQEFHHPAGGIQAEGAAPGDANRVDLIDHVQAQQGIQLPGAGGGTPDVHAPDGVRRAEDHRHAGEVLVVAHMAHGKTGHPGDHGAASADTTCPLRMVRR